MATLRFDTADVAASPALAFGELTLTVPEERAEATREALAALGFTVKETIIPPKEGG